MGNESSIEFDSKSTNSTPLENLNNKQYHHKFSHQKNENTNKLLNDLKCQNVDLTNELISN